MSEQLLQLQPKAIRIGFRGWGKPVENHPKGVETPAACKYTQYPRHNYSNYG